MAAAVRIGLLGLGTVNGAVARRLLGERELLASRAGASVELAGVVVRDAAKARGIPLGDVPLSTDADALVTAESIDIVIEAMGGVDPARRLIAAALESGKDVVTANKAVIAAHGPELSAIAARQGVTLRFSAAVGGAVPVLEVAGTALRGDRISAVECICNGTTNVILSRMSRDGVAFDTALAEAQRLGFAEADPTSDVDGFDSAYKLAILASALWDGWLDAGQIRRRGIRDVQTLDLRHARDLGCAVKLLARATWDGHRVSASVQPTLLVAGQHPLAQIDGGDNGFLLRGDLCGSTLVVGQGAGGDATASAVVSDIVRCVREGRSAWTPLPAAALPVASDDDAECAVYIRVTTNSSAASDEVAQMLEDRGVPVASLSESAPHDVIVLTGPAPVAVVDRSLDTLDSMASVDRVAACLEVAGSD